MSSITPEQRRMLRERFDANVAAARMGGMQPSGYFLDKCGSEAGDTRDAHETGQRDLQHAQEPERTSTAVTSSAGTNKRGTWLQSRFRDEQRARETIAGFAVGGALLGLAVVLLGLWAV